MKKLMKKGFTLVELIVVIAIIAILAAVSVAGYFGFMAQARQSRADTEGAQVREVLRGAGAKSYAPKKLAAGCNVTVDDDNEWTSISFQLATGGLSVSGIAEDSEINVARLLANAYTYMTVENATTATPYAIGIAAAAPAYDGSKASYPQIVVLDADYESNVLKQFTYVSVEKVSSVVTF